MPVIHIHDDDTDFLMSIVSLIMRSDTVPARVVIDHNDCDDEPIGGTTTTEHDQYIQASWDFIAQRDVDRRAAEAAEAAVALAASAAPHPLVSAVMAAQDRPATKAETKAAKAAMVAEIKRREKALIADVIGSLACPTCHSPRGVECATPGGAGYGRSFVHNARRLAMNAMVQS